MFALQKGFCSFNFATRSDLGVNTSKIRIFMYKALRENDEDFLFWQFLHNTCGYIKGVPLLSKLYTKGQGLKLGAEPPV